MIALLHVHIITFAEFVLQDCHKETVSTRVGLTRPVTFKRESSFTVRWKSSALWRYTAYTELQTSMFALEAYFLLCDAMLARYLLSSCVCLPVQAGT